MDSGIPLRAAFDSTVIGFTRRTSATRAAAASGPYSMGRTGRAAPSEGSLGLELVSYGIFFDSRFVMPHRQMMTARHLTDRTYRASTRAARTPVVADGPTHRQRRLRALVLPDAGVGGPGRSIGHGRVRSRASPAGCALWRPVRPVCAHAIIAVSQEPSCPLASVMLRSPRRSSMRCVGSSTPARPSWLGLARAARSSSGAGSSMTCLPSAPPLPCCISTTKPGCAPCWGCRDERRTADQGRGRRPSSGPRAIAAILRRVKRHLLVVLLLLISGCSTSSRPAFSAKARPERASRDTEAGPSAGSVQRDGAGAPVFLERGFACAPLWDPRRIMTADRSHPAARRHPVRRAWRDLRDRVVANPATDYAVTGERAPRRARPQDSVVSVAGTRLLSGQPT